MKERRCYKFHFKNEKASNHYSCDVDLDTYTDAMKFAYDKLDELNNNQTGYRIIGVYEILYPLNGGNIQEQIN
jgi:hypothetical protein